MSVDTSSMFSRVIEDHLALKERNTRLDGTMPIERYKDEDPFDNHALFKSEEQARIEETMDGVEVDPDFSDESLEDVGLGLWPGQQQAPTADAAVTEPVAEEPQAVVEDATVENATLPVEDETAAPVEEDSGFWNTSGAREFDWGE